MKTSKKKLFLIPLKFRGKPFLGLAQLSKIFLYLNPKDLKFCDNCNFDPLYILEKSILSFKSLVIQRNLKPHFQEKGFYFWFSTKKRRYL